jgi:hypothetical protein
MDRIYQWGVYCTGLARDEFAEEALLHLFLEVQWHLHLGSADFALEVLAKFQNDAVSRRSVQIKTVYFVKDMVDDLLFDSDSDSNSDSNSDFSTKDSDSDSDFEASESTEMGIDSDFDMETDSLSYHKSITSPGELLSGTFRAKTASTWSRILWDHPDWWLEVCSNWKDSLRRALDEKVRCLI